MQCRRQVLNCCNYDTAVKNKKRKQKRTFESGVMTYYSGICAADFTIHTETGILHVITARFVQKSPIFLCFSKQFVLSGTRLRMFILIVTFGIYTGAF